MSNVIDDLIIKAKYGNTDALIQVINYFNLTIKNLTMKEKKESQKDYHEMLISELTIKIYELDEHRVKNKKAYLWTCLKNYFIKINKWSKVDLNIEGSSEPSELDKYELDKNNKIDDYLKILANFLNTKQLNIFKMRVIDNRSVSDISKFYSVTENDIYKILKKIKKNIFNNTKLKEIIINEFLYN